MCLLELAECMQVAGEVRGRVEGRGMIVTEDLAAAGVGVLVERAACSCWV